MPLTNSFIGVNRRSLVLGALALGSLSLALAKDEQTLTIQVWKDPNCGCCRDWISHIEKNGFSVKVMDEGNPSARSELGVPVKYASCHTALVAGYFIEGHVPALDIKKMLAQKPIALGLAVPGMPLGSPGMDGGVYGGRRDPFKVLLIQKDGSASVYNSYS
jgi:hypothetical protein